MTAAERARKRRTMGDLQGSGDAEASRAPRPSLDFSKTTSVVSAKGWVVIPKAFRERHGLTKGTRVSFIELDGVVSIVRAPDDPLDGLLGILNAPEGVSVTQELVEDRRREVEAEEAQEAEFRKRRSEAR